MATKNRLAKL